MTKRTTTTGGNMNNDAQALVAGIRQAVVTTAHEQAGAVMLRVRQSLPTSRTRRPIPLRTKMKAGDRDVETVGELLDIIHGAIADHLVEEAVNDRIAHLTELSEGGKL